MWLVSLPSPGLCLFADTNTKQLCSQDKGCLSWGEIRPASRLRWSVLLSFSPADWVHFQVLQWFIMRDKLVRGDVASFAVILMFLICIWALQRWKETSVVSCCSPALSCRQYSQLQCEWLSNIHSIHIWGSSISGLKPRSSSPPRFNRF